VVSDKKDGEGKGKGKVKGKTLAEVFGGGGLSGAFTGEGVLPTGGGAGVDETREGDSFLLKPPTTKEELLELHDKLSAALGCMGFTSVTINVVGDGMLPKMTLEAVGKGCVMASEVFMRGAETFKNMMLAHDDELVDKVSSVIREEVKRLSLDSPATRLIALDPFAGEASKVELFSFLRGVASDDLGLGRDNAELFANAVTKFVCKYSREAGSRSAATLVKEGAKLSVFASDDEGEEAGGSDELAGIGLADIGLADIVGRRRGKGSW